MAVCQECARSASYSCSQDGVQMWLCERCADERSGIQGLSQLALSLCGRPRTIDTCPHCGTTAEEVNSTELVGCPLCYVALASAIESLGSDVG